MALKSTLEVVANVYQLAVLEFLKSNLEVVANVYQLALLEFLKSNLEVVANVNQLAVLEFGRSNGRHFEEFVLPGEFVMRCYRPAVQGTDLVRLRLRFALG